jgi:hypothetical protein
MEVIYFKQTKLLISYGLIDFYPCKVVVRLSPAKFIFLIYPLLLTWQAKIQLPISKVHSHVSKKLDFLSVTSAKEGKSKQ